MQRNHALIVMETWLDTAVYDLSHGKGEELWVQEKVHLKVFKRLLIV